MTTISNNELKEILIDDDGLVIDTRPMSDYADGFINGSINLPLHTAGTEDIISIYGIQSKIALVCLPNQEQDSIDYVRKLGYSNIIGVLEAGFNGWKMQGEPIDVIIIIETDELVMDLPHDDALMIIDVRTQIEFAHGHIEDAHNLPLIEMGDPAGIALLPEEANLYIHCSNQVRSIIAAGIFKHHGLHNFRVIGASWDELSNTEGIKVEKDKALLN